MQNYKYRALYKVRKCLYSKLLLLEQKISWGVINNLKEGMKKKKTIIEIFGKSIKYTLMVIYIIPLTVQNTIVCIRNCIYWPYTQCIPMICENIWTILDGIDKLNKNFTIGNWMGRKDFALLPCPPPPIPSILMTMHKFRCCNDNT